MRSLLALSLNRHDPARAMFNLHPQIQRLPIDEHQACWLVDDALRDPQAWVRVAMQQRPQFRDNPHNAFPGLELELPEGITARMDDFFTLHFRQRLNARRVERSHSRLSLVTQSPAQLQPPQWICHRDRLDSNPQQLIAASVLYLFEDPRLGGTSFYSARRPSAEIAQLVHDSGQMAPHRFTEIYGVQRGYMTDSNHWFERVLTVEPRFNRMIVYDGGIFHGADLCQPERLAADPQRGRLTWNGFFTCTRKAS
jgi:hypothetical protein